jgi:hypothetical protein
MPAMAKMTTSAEGAQAPAPDPIQDAIEQIENDYFAQDENQQLALERLHALHFELWDRQDAEGLLEFRAEAALIGGGIYLPYLFWPELHAFLTTDGANRLRIYDMIQALATSDFDEHVQTLLKPLLVVYFSKEKAFELDKLRTFILAQAHASVKEYFDKLFAFVTQNKASVSTYQAKFALVSARFPDFELFAQPLQRLQEQL